MAYLSTINTAVPGYCYPQMDLAGYMGKVYGGDAEFNRKLQLMYGRSGIRTRYSCMPDFMGNAKSSLLNFDWHTGVSERMRVFATEATNLSVNAIKPLLTRIPKEKISHLITVSCTGMAAPGLDLWLMKELQLHPSVHRSSVNFMGCYAAIHGLKLAAAIANSEKDANVLLVCTELCTLHFRADAAWEQVAAISLFADGSAACMVSSKQDDTSQSEILGFYSEVHAEGQKDMAWHIREDGFQMELSQYIPDLLGINIGPFVEKARQKTGINKIDQWCFHPGGRKILDFIALNLQLEKSALAPSYEVLENYGNMSSATVMFVQQKCNETALPGDVTFSAAFGPGITLESMFSRKI